MRSRPDSTARNFFVGLLLIAFLGSSGLLTWWSTSKAKTVSVSVSTLPPLVQPNQRSNILVTIKPRHPQGENGTATIQLLNAAGEPVAAAVALFNGLGKGIKGPRRDVHFGDTPFGVYRFVRAAGGEPGSQISEGYGTGKIYVDDNDMFGEVVDVHRGTIRLHGGGSALPDPYAPDQRLVATKGCVRMRNRDVSGLIQAIKNLSPAQKPDFIFMGSAAYLNALATDDSMAHKEWWNVLRIDLHLPPASPSEMVLVDWKERASFFAPNLPQIDSQLLELIKTFAEDVGPRGNEALNHLRTRDSLPAPGNFPADDPLRPMMAFTLCYLGRNCENNIPIIESALSVPSPFKGFYADDAQEMLSRLIDRAGAEGRQTDVKNMLVKLLQASVKADGALAEGLGVTLSAKLRDQTAAFVNALQDVSGGVEISTSARTSALARVNSFGRLFNEG